VDELIAYPRRWTLAMRKKAPHSKEEVAWTARTIGGRKGSMMGSTASSDYGARMKMD